MFDKSAFLMICCEISIKSFEIASENCTKTNKKTVEVSG